MPSDVDETWDRIVGWLGRHAPAVAGAIDPPAAEPALAQVEAAVGSPLPADLVAWWRRADGMRWTDPHPGALLPPHFVPHSVRGALESRRTWLEVMSSLYEGAEPPPGAAGSPSDVWLPMWMPIAANGGGTELFVDLRDGPAHGCVMTYDKVGAAALAPRWPSVTAMLAEVADALENEVPVQGVRIWVSEDGTISWDSDRGRWSAGGSGPVILPWLRERYAAFVAEVLAGGFAPPPAGSWPAEWIAAHVARNTELLIATTEAVLADDPAGRERAQSEAWAAQDWTRLRRLKDSAERAAAHLRYDNSDTMDPATLDRYAGHGLTALADQISQLGGHLCGLAEPLNRGRPTAQVRIVESGTTIIDGRQGWLGVLNSLWMRQLPLRTRQLRALR
ncbi:SMI1/KNR4 family protein [Actinomadura scrupuli]|uniref:SMI1/KNR4 family protein n=1 Tax=Actinomadura scrupuli TaxID=559629 RepID=UPI003D99D910